MINTIQAIGVVVGQALTSPLSVGSRYDSSASCGREGSKRRPAVASSAGARVSDDVAAERNPFHPPVPSPCARAGDRANTALDADVGRGTIR